MPVDYSKWDALELSDDSDIEVHPNVDKKSFIRAKQNQIHQQRAQRRHQIATLQYERIINDGLLMRIDRLLTALKSHKTSSQTADELVFQSLIESAGNPTEDKPPAPPPGIHQNAQEQPTYSKMMASLIDQVRKEVKEKKIEDEYDAYIEGIGEHRSKVDGLQKELYIKLEELEKEEKRHITSDNIHDGFNHSAVAPKNAPNTAKSSGTTTAETVELLNAPASRPLLKSTDTGQSSGADADVEDGPDPDDVDDDNENLKPTALGQRFGRISIGDYRTSLQFISENPSILTERETDGLLVQAFDSQMEGQAKYAKQCVHQALLLQYCRQLGRDGVGLFFRRITTPGHQAGKLFSDDVNDTYNKIRVRAAELAKQKTDEPDGVEQIQLHAVDPNTTINISVPPPIPKDLAAKSTQPPPTEDQIAARQVFESFPPGLQRALESGKLDEINRVLGRMSVEEAEEVVAKLGDGGMLNLEDKVIDATTDEGKRLVKEIERTGRLPTDEEDHIAADWSADPPMD